MHERKTNNGRVIEEIYSDSPVSRVRIKKDTLVLRYSKTSTEMHRDDIYDAIISLERRIPITSPTVRLKILDTDHLNTLQCEIGNTESQTKLIKHRGVDY